MNAGVLLALGLPALAGALLVVRASGDRGAWPWAVPVGAGLGVGLSSIVWALWLLTLAPGHPVGTLVVVDAIVWSAVAAGVSLTLWRRPPARHDRPALPSPAALRWGAAIAVVALAAIAGATFLLRTIALPHGTGDAWGIWNFRARSLFRAYPTAWLDGFASAPAWSHADYPLLVPLAVARGWAYAGGETTAMPASLAACFWLAAIAAVAGGVGRSRGLTAGLLSAALLFASPLAVIHGSSQCADLPLAFFVVSAFVLMAAAVETGASPLWALSGLSAGLAAWTKNEGLAFFGLYVLVSAWWLMRRACIAAWRRLALMFGGAALPLAAVVAFKVWLAPQNDLVAGQSIPAIVARLTDMQRFVAVATAFARDVWFGAAPWVGPLPITAAFLVASGVRGGGNPVPAPASAAGLSLILLYAVVYLLTPQDLAWHLASSSDRLILHVTPLFVWAAMMMASAGNREPGAGSRSP